MKCSIKNLQLLIAVQLLIVNEVHSRPEHCEPLSKCDHILHLLEQNDSKNDTSVINGLVDSLSCGGQGREQMIKCPIVTGLLIKLAVYICWPPFIQWREKGVDHS